MKRKEEIYDLIDKYLRQELSIEEQKKFRLLQETDSDFREELELHKEIKEALIEKKVQVFGDTIKSYVKTNPKTLPEKWFFSKKYFWIILILLISIITFFLFKNKLFHSSPIDLFQQYAMAPEEFYLTKNYAIIRDVQEKQTQPTDSILQNLEKLYQEYKYDQLIHILSDQGVNYWPESAEYHFQLGVLYLFSGQYQSAIYHLRRGASSRPEATHWYKGLAFLKTTDYQVDSIRSELSPLTTYQNPYQEQAKEILRKLE